MTPPGRHPGPRLDLDVPTIILDTAERLFAVEGFRSVSLRAVGRAADVSSAGVLYHYSSKPALLADVIQRRGRAAGQQTRTNFLSLLDADRISTRDLVDALLDPMVAVINADPEGGLSWFKLLGQLVALEEEVWLEQVRSEPALDELVLRAAARAMPALGAAELQRRLVVGVGAMWTALAGVDLPGTESQADAKGLDPAFVATVARFTAAGLAAD